MNTHTDDYKKSYIREMAEEDFECGHPFDPDDFNNFKKGIKEDTGLEVSHTDFVLYFNFIDEIREEQSYDFE